MFAACAISCRAYLTRSPPQYIFYNFMSCIRSPTPIDTQDPSFEAVAAFNRRYQPPTYLESNQNQTPATSPSKLNPGHQAVNRTVSTATSASRPVPSNPSTIRLNPEPRGLNPTPSTLNTQTSILNTQLPTLDPPSKPLVLSPCPYPHIPSPEPQSQNPKRLNQPHRCVAVDSEAVLMYMPMAYPRQDPDDNSTLPPPPTDLCHLSEVLSINKLKHGRFGFLVEVVLPAGDFKLNLHPEP